MPYNRFVPLDFNDYVPVYRFGDGETPDPWTAAPSGDPEEGEPR